jgi:hypothetical protein
MNPILRVRFFHLRERRAEPFAKGEIVSCLVANKGIGIVSPYSWIIDYYR